MTAMKDALERAGLNTEARELRSEAERFLNSNGGRPERAVAGFMRAISKNDKLFRALCVDYLERVSGRPAEPAPAPAPAPDKKSKSVHVDEHKRTRPKERTKAQKGSEIRAVVGGLLDKLQIGRQAIGDVTIADLRLAKKEDLRETAGHMQAGIYSLTFAILKQKILNHGQVPDDRMTVRQVVSEEQLSAYFIQAKKEAPSVMPVMIMAAAATMKEKLENNALS